MRKVLLFGEDVGHALVLRALVERVAQERRLAVVVEVRQAEGGYGTLLEALRVFVRLLPAGREPLPDLLLAVRDANCKGYSECKEGVAHVLAGYPAPVVTAIPDPHIERWLLLDSAAFKSVFGKGCVAPDNKCERDRYKERLTQAVRDAGETPSLGGLEYAEALVREMDLPRLERKDASLGHLLQDLREQFNQWELA
jgi:hypothetical protein